MSTPLPATETATEPQPQFVNVKLPGDLALLLHQLTFERRMSKTALVIEALRSTYVNK